MNKWQAEARGFLKYKIKSLWKIASCIFAVIVLVFLWLQTILNYERYLVVFTLLGLLFSALIVVYVIVLLLIMIHDEIFT